jgi:hypothetical protein
MNRKTLIIFFIVLAGASVEAVFVLALTGFIPTCGCQNQNGQPYSWCPVSPCPSQEALTIDSYQVNSPTNVTLFVRNLGPASVTLVAYYVKDASSGQQFSHNNWSGPTIAPAGTLGLKIIIDGQAFSFQSGRSYSVVLVTSRNNQYFFAVTA